MKTITIRTILGVVAVAAFSSAALASTPLPPASGLYNPLVSGGPLYPAYDTVFPSGLTYLNSVTSPIMSTKTGDDGSKMWGTATSTLWMNANHQLTFEYQFNEQGTSEIETASFASAPWQGVAITDAGSDGTGHSQADSGSTYTWNTGDPYSISRANAQNGTVQNPYISWSSTPYGTYLVGSGTEALTGLSANIWFSTDATGWQYSDTSFQDSSATGSAQLLVPGTTPPAVPEPITMAGLLLGVGALGRYWSRKQTNAVN